MWALAIIVVMILSLRSIVYTLEKLTDKILEKQERQNQLLEEIKAKLESNSYKI